MLRVVIVSLLLSVSAVASPDNSDIEFFEKNVRPILAEHCQECHGSKKQEAGLRMDSAAAFRKGGDSGAVFDPKSPSDSRLLRAIQYKDDLRMPPDGRLSDEQIDSISRWLKAGAKWPQEMGSQPPERRLSIAAQAKSHWAFQPVASPDVPVPINASWGRTPIDAFVKKAQEQSGIEPASPADRRTLIRRATFDLHGLPPTPDEVRTFERDESPAAWEKLIDRLLASPRYGERWARHWLDVARYSDTKGYVRLKDNPLYPAAWTYRDYVIRSFNEDLPYNQFVLEQLAADKLAAKDAADPRSLAAMGFLTLGQRFINSQNDIIDDRIDVVTRGLLGLTVSCARCHDHKFDPVPTADYYSLHGVFASSVEPDVPPMILTQAELPKFEPYTQELRRRTKAFEDFLTAQQSRLETSFRTRAAEYLLAGQSEKVQANFLPVMFLIDATKDLNPAVVQRWARLLESSRRAHHPVLAPWNRLAQLSTSVSPEQFPSTAAAMINEWRQQPHADRLNMAIVESLTTAPLTGLPDVASRYGAVFANVQRLSAADPSTPIAAPLKDEDLEEVRQLIFGPMSPSAVSLRDVPDFLFVDATAQNQYHEQQRLIEDWIASPGAAPHAHILQDAEVPVDSRIFLRGNASNPGNSVPRQFLEVLSHSDRRPFQNGSGRLELAEAIIDPSNPLTARVLVNRIWMHHFGTALVRTPSDFGLRGEAPTHPELLDYLASRFMKDGWSIKSLHRLIMLSSVYQQQSDGNISAEHRDPENRLLWKMNRQRLDWESMRDSLLAVSGQIDLTASGPSVPLLAPPFSKRRSVYGFIDRQNLPGLLRTFDVVAPDSSAPQRHQTTVPQQALYLMNSAFLKEQSLAIAARIDDIQGTSSTDSGERNEQRIDGLYWLLFGRPASREDRDLGLHYLTTPAELTAEQSTGTATPELSRWEEYVQALLMSNEFLFID